MAIKNNWVKATGEGKVDYDFWSYWDSALAPWEKEYFPPGGTMGIIRFYNFDVASAVVKHGHVVGYTWLGKPLLEASMENNKEILVIGAHSNTGNRKFNHDLAIGRAASVAEFLGSEGIPFDRMSIIGSKTLDRDSRGESEKWRAVSVLFTAHVTPPYPNFL